MTERSMADSYWVGTDDLPDDLAGWIKPELEPGEHLLWVALSTPRGTGLGCFLGGGLLSALLMGFGALVVATSSPGQETLAVVLFGIGGIGSVVTVLAWVSDRNGRARSRRKRYALTDRRAIIWVPLARHGAVQVYSYRQGEIKQVHRVEYPDGCGDVLFGLLTNDGEDPWVRNGFEGVAEVRRVEERVRGTLRGVDPGT